MSGEALALQMKPMAPDQGKPDYRFDGSESPAARGGYCDTTGPVGPGGCPPTGCAYVGDGTVVNKPTPLCATTQQTYSLFYSGAKLPALYTIPPVGTMECSGFQLDSLNRLPEGPTCVIVRATDVAGNTNVSYPLHICIDRGGTACGTFNPAATRCTGVYDKVQQKIVAGTCLPPTQQSSTNLHPSPGTFSTSGKELRNTDDGSSKVP